MKKAMETGLLDVIALCGADGRLRPLRLRLRDENGKELRGDVTEIVRTQKLGCFSSEAELFICRVRVGSRQELAELKFTACDHRWELVRIGFV